MTEFYDLLRGTRGLPYIAFDIGWLDSADLRYLPLHERLRRLRAFSRRDHQSISEALSVVGRGRELFELMRGRGSGQRSTGWR